MSTIFGSTTTASSSNNNAKALAKYRKRLDLKNKNNNQNNTQNFNGNTNNNKLINNQNSNNNINSLQSIITNNLNSHENSTHNKPINLNSNPNNTSNITKNNHIITPITPTKSLIVSSNSTWDLEKTLQNFNENGSLPPILSPTLPPWTKNILDIPDDDISGRNNHKKSLSNNFSRNVNHNNNNEKRKLRKISSKLKLSINPNQNDISDSDDDDLPKILSPTIPSIFNSPNNNNANNFTLNNNNNSNNNIIHPLPKKIIKVSNLENNLINFNNIPNTKINKNKYVLNIHNRSLKVILYIPPSKLSTIKNKISTKLNNNTDQESKKPLPSTKKLSSFKNLKQSISKQLQPQSQSQSQSQFQSQLQKRKLSISQSNLNNISNNNSFDTNNNDNKNIGIKSGLLSPIHINSVRENNNNSKSNAINNTLNNSLNIKDKEKSTDKFIDKSIEKSKDMKQKERLKPKIIEKEKEKEKERENLILKENTKDRQREKIKDKPKEKFKERVKEQPKEKSKEKPKDQSKDISKERYKENPKEREFSYPNPNLTPNINNNLRNITAVSSPTNSISSVSRGERNFENKDSTRSILLNKKKYWFEKAKQKKAEVDRIKTALPPNNKNFLLFISSSLDVILTYIIAYNYDERALNFEKRLPSEKNWKSLPLLIDGIIQFIKSKRDIIHPRILGLCYQIKSAILEHMRCLISQRTTRLVKRQEELRNIKQRRSEEKEELEEINDKFISLMPILLSYSNSSKKYLLLGEEFLSFKLLETTFPRTFSRNLNFQSQYFKHIQVLKFNGKNTISMIDFFDNKNNDGNQNPPDDYFYLPFNNYLSLQQVCAYSYSIINEWVQLENITNFNWSFDNKRNS
ncbi:uncharacterized protein ASCRUDRAFT_98158 [Ascoidea rubescens DSM 1968]|uniref:Uncharacterized protein n=1 Tax=Ascoidea rubescens DSM 1968 TaxID=1344418 RepID=A0A1D2VQ12_9ASCO|nr:hypothetical protein ASCRUDRAFT_98158 [Ascoidea rubescens DSM 1968]ODV63701.1 hypothetical protein ASCRUDRAFT_98158 [Ascoidea rubescens DSM 1968]